MLGAAAVNSIKSIPFSDTTMARRIEEMACGVSQQVIEKIKQDKRFVLQLDESTDISNQAQLLMYVRYYDEGIKDQILACINLLGKTTGEKLFKVLDGHIRTEYDFNWEWCTSISSDAATSMTGHTNGLIARLKFDKRNVNACGQVSEEDEKYENNTLTQHALPEWKADYIAANYSTVIYQHRGLASINLCSSLHLLVDNVAGDHSGCPTGEKSWCRWRNPSGSSASTALTAFKPIDIEKVKVELNTYATDEFCSHLTL
ncbi:SCAN domain-containing protein 3-like [Oopsacas minuta]|uniref:SCAN domain-containing protein 3-like n=1 Tax=Oopsacas minuta TaxID=111878 RepID=A0AAV7KG98_9METZ|nr:SCAN domain-containing protein 3-like [Oopsacas minuta]